MFFDKINEEFINAFSPILSTIESIFIIDGANIAAPHVIGIRFIMYFNTIHLCLKNLHSVNFEKINPVANVIKFDGTIINKSI
jgi:hypothetical protein